MKISQLIALLEQQQEQLGDVEVTMQATLLPDGYCAAGNVADVFESTVESVQELDEGRLGMRLRLFWQC
ncbi:hypothetical protein [Ferrimonas aestuarii]|uniref:Uncharacterized protein n=1 Tax=Ferrimonas aestuarii TaxID=2569539 RepID=A0A4U1BLY0_9GAMM|nr:hypothetical protein [Ferrimonas aestuarii]TKB53317.1 hypothetical protein FCL42_14710 [Ferrimonas aestuarii]